uniref:Immunoglobulin domain-containing protein n=1 Tax=Sphenodon punctatus TaxID=8508 RepID=A0A8D0GWF9_SPHPU
PVVFFRGWVHVTFVQNGKESQFLPHFSAVCWGLRGHSRVAGPLNGSVSVPCRYGEDDKHFVKYWCREASYRFCSNSHITRTLGTEAEVKVGRVSIRDDQALHTFTVTLEDLSSGDSGTYLCGVERTGSFDLWYPVEVIVASASPTSISIGRMVETAKKPDIMSGQEDEFHPTTSAASSHLHFLLLIFLKVPIFLSMVGALIWVSVRYRGSSRKQALESRNESGQSSLPQLRVQSRLPSHLLIPLTYTNVNQEGGH